MVTINRSSAAIIVLAIFTSYPFLSAFLLGGLFATNDTDFSIYNTGWNGASEFKKRFQDHPNQAQISTIIGSSNVLNRLNESEMNDSRGALIILGPAVHYDFTEALAILMYAINGGRVLIADDFGTANDILDMFSVFLGLMAQMDLADAGVDLLGGATGAEDTGINPFGMNTTEQNETADDGECDVSANFPIAGIAINGSLLVDQGSYNYTPLTPVFSSPSTVQQGTSYQMPAPWVSDFTTGLSGNGVIGNFASIITMKVRYPNTSTIDKNGNGAVNETCDIEYITKWVPMGEFPASASDAFDDLKDQGIPIPDVSFSLQIAVLYSSSNAWMESDLIAAKNDVNSIKPDPDEWGNPNVGFPVFVYFPFPLGGQIIICSDPSIFINQYLDTTNYPGSAIYDNSDFTDNVVNTIMRSTSGDSREGQTVIFDEGHLANNPLSPTLPLSLYLKFLDMITMFPLFAWALPILAIVLSRRFMPKRTQAKPLLLTRVERYYGRSFFAVKMRWFLEYQQYSRGLELIYRRLNRNLTRRYAPDTGLNPEITASYLVSDFPERFNERDLIRGLTLIEEIIVTRAIISEQEFLDHYLFLKNIGVEIG